MAKHMDYYLWSAHRHIFNYKCDSINQFGPRSTAWCFLGFWRETSCSEWIFMFGSSKLYSHLQLMMTSNFKHQVWVLPFIRFFWESISVFTTFLLFSIQMEKMRLAPLNELKLMFSHSRCGAKNCWRVGVVCTHSARIVYSNENGASSKIRNKYFHQGYTKCMFSCVLFE